MQRCEGGATIAVVRSDAVRQISVDADHAPPHAVCVTAGVLINGKKLGSPPTIGSCARWSNPSRTSRIRCGHIFGRKEAKRSMMQFTKIQKIRARVAVGAVALVSLLSMTASTRAQDAERAYPKMLPLSEYLMARNAAIVLARSAAPEAISKDASVLVLTPKGWETAVKGTNGFVCMAGPSWTASIDFYDVWSPKQRGAICLNPAAVRSILPIFRKLTQMTL